MRRAIALSLLLGGCARGPGLTPLEQAGLETVAKPLKEGLIYTIDIVAKPPEVDLLMAMLNEFERSPFFLQVVWRTPKPPQTQNLAWFPGKRVRQYWDPQRLTPSTLGKMLAAGQSVAIEPLPLRMAFARAAVSFHN